MEASLFVLDTSAIIAVLEDEPEAPVVVDILSRAERGQGTVLVPFIALMEVEYILSRRLGAERAASMMSMLENWPVTVMESDVEWRHEAARIKGSGGLSIADAWMAALTILNDAQLVHKDREFAKVRGLRSVKL